MARSRNIKPGFFRNEELVECEPLARILFAGLWTVADREGRLEDRPKRIKMDVLPGDNCDVDALLNQLAKHEFIIRYEVNGAKYIQVTNFRRHQNPHCEEKTSIIPPPCNYGGNRADSFNLIPSSQIPDSSNSPPSADADDPSDSSQPSDAKGTPPSRPKARPAYSVAFERWWLVYPRHVGKQDAAAAFGRALVRIARSRDLSPADALEWLLERTIAFAESPAGAAGQFTPHGATWLNQGRYDDDTSEWNRDRSATASGSRPKIPEVKFL